MDTNDVARALTARLGAKYELYRDILPAVIKSVDGSVHPTGRADMVWVAEFGLDGSRVKVYNNTTLDTAETPVWVGPDPKRPDTRAVIGLYNGDLSPVQASATSPHNVPVHGQNHQYPSESDPGGDPVFVFQPAWQPLKTTGDGATLTVSIQPLVYLYEGVRKEYLGEDLDMTSYVPSTSSRKASFHIYLDPATNTIGVESGAEVATGGAISAPLPDCPRGMIPSAWIELANGQTDITTASDITDGRGMMYQRAFTNPFGPFRWVWEDATARGAETDVADEDVQNYRLGLQLDNNVLYRATATTPTWQSMTGGNVDITETANGFTIQGGTTNEQKLVVETAEVDDPSTYYFLLIPYNGDANAEIRAGESEESTLEFYGINLIQEVSISGNGFTLTMDDDVQIDQDLTTGSDLVIASVTIEDTVAIVNQTASATTSKTVWYHLTNRTTDATPTELFINPGASTRLSIPANSVMAFRITVAARRQDADNESAGYWFQGVIDNNGGTTALVGSVTADTPVEDTPAWSVAVTADNTNDALVVTVTGEGSKTIDWAATVEATIITE